MGTVLDLHVHSLFSVDSPVAPEQYAAHLAGLRQRFRIDGMVFCEHRKLAADFDYQALAEKYGIKIMAGVEAETRWGHILVYCADLNWLRAVNFEQKLDPVELAREVELHGGITVPAHPFRGMISLGDHIQELPHLCALEVINGGNLPEENLWALNLAQKLGLSKVGGSDAHFLDELGLGATEFEAEINTLEELVREIKSGRVRAVYRDELRIASDPA